MAAHRCGANLAFQRRRGCNVRPGEMTASCAAAAAVTAAVKAFAAGPPRARNEFSNARTVPSAQSKPLNPKGICNQLSKQQPCPPSTRPAANAGAGTGTEEGKEGEKRQSSQTSPAGTDTGAGTGAAETSTGAGPAAGTEAGACVDPNVLNIKAHICIDLNPIRPGSQEACLPSQQESSVSQGRGPKSQEPCPPSQQESSGSQGRGPRSQEPCPPSQQESSGSQGRGPRSQEPCPPSQQESSGSQGRGPRSQEPSSQQELTGSQRRLPQSQAQGPQFQSPETAGQDGASNKANKAKNGSGQVLALARGEMSRQNIRPHTVGSCVCDGKVTPANASFRARTPRFSTEAPDTRPWYCNTPSFHETNLPKTPLSRAPPNAPFFHSAARFTSDTRFKAPAPNTYLPPVMSRVRWSGILTGYHGIPTCYNVVDRNCDLSTVHMHCIMCPPRGVYNKSIGLPLHEIYPDDKQRDEQLRHMCTWHTGEVKRAYHERGMFTRGCTDGVEGRTDIGPSGFRTGNIGCSCTRRDNLGGAFDDATLQKMAEALNRKKRDPDTFTPSAVCMKFAEESAATDVTEAEKLKRDRAEECKRRCVEYRKMKKEGEGTTGETRSMESAVSKPHQGPGKDTLRSPAMKPSGIAESRPSRIGEPAEGRLPCVTEEAQMQWNDEDAATKSSGRISKKSSGVLSKISSGRVSTKSSEVCTKKSSGAISKTSSRVGSGKSSASLSKKSSGVMFDKSGAVPRECEDAAEESVSSAEILEGATDTFLPQTVQECPPEAYGYQDTGSERLPSRTPSRISGASLAPVSADNCSTGTGRQSVGTYAQDGVSRQSVGINVQDSTKRQSEGTNLQDSKSGAEPCPPITFECNCALYNKNAVNMPFPPAPQGGGSQYGEQNFGQQTSQTPYGQQYCAQGQQYGAQQYGTAGQTYGARVKLCFAPNGQSAGTNTQQYGPQDQPYGQQYSMQPQQYRPDVQSQQSEQQQTRSDCFSCAPCFATQQLSLDGNSASSSVRKVCIPPSGTPACPPNDPSQIHDDQ